MTKVEKIDNLKIIYKDNKKICIKKTNNIFIDRQRYLSSKNFLNYIPTKIENEYEIREYIDQIPISNEDKISELIYLICLLHTKTTHYKNLDLDRIKEFYEKETNEIIELKRYYELLFENCIYKFLPPSIIMLISNTSLIINSLDESKRKLDEWYEIIKVKKRKRVVLNHNNLKISNLIVGNNLYLINWNNSIIDYPIYDLLSLFKNNYKIIDMIDIYNIYLSKYGLLKEEKLLLYSKLLRVLKIDFTKSEIENTKIVTDTINYLKSTKNFLDNNIEQKK